MPTIRLSNISTLQLALTHMCIWYQSSSALIESKKVIGQAIYYQTGYSIYL